MTAPLRLSIDLEHDRSRAVELLANGGVLAVPTDTVYGVAASLSSPAAIKTIYQLKGRPKDKPLPVLVADPTDASTLSGPLDPRIIRFLERAWPGAVTVILPAASDLPMAVLGLTSSGETTVGLRVPDHTGLRALIRALGSPIATTSANRSGDAPALTADEAESAFLASTGVALAAVLAGSTRSSGQASVVFDVTESPPKVLRQGPDADRILALWHETVDG